MATHLFPLSHDVPAIVRVKRAARQGANPMTADLVTPYDIDTQTHAGTKKYHRARQEGQVAANFMNHSVIAIVLRFLGDMILRLFS